MVSFAEKKLHEDERLVASHTENAVLSGTASSFARRPQLSQQNMAS